MRSYTFSAEAAKQYGLDGAVLLQGMAYWIEKNAANKRHQHDGRWWTYNSAEALTELFPFWSRRQIQRITGQLTEAGALIIGRFSSGSDHNVNWYALSDDALRLVGASEKCFSRLVSATAQDGAVSGNGESTARNGAVTTARNGADYRTKRCSLNMYQNNTTNTPYSPPEGDASEAGSQVDRIAAEFDHLYRLWPRDESDEVRRRALDAYRQERQKGAGFETMMTAIRCWADAGGAEWFSLWRVLDGRVWPEEPYFWLFWQAYPRKIDKDKARRAWRKIRPDKQMALEMLQSLKRWKTCDQWQDERYIPHPSVWLNNRRWEAQPPNGGSSAATSAPEKLEEWT